VEQRAKRLTRRACHGSRYSEDNPYHEFVSKKEDCGSSTSKVGESATRQAIDPLSQTRCEDQEENNEPSSQKKSLRQIKGLLGSKESQQKVTFCNLYFNSPSDFCGSELPSTKIILSTRLNETRVRLRIDNRATVRQIGRLSLTLRLPPTGGLTKDSLN
jgi:hypothetical protein